MEYGKIIEWLYEELIPICNHITKGGRLTDDLRQEVIEFILTQPQEKIIEIHANDKLGIFAYSVAYRFYNMSGTKFFITERTFEINNILAKQGDDDIDRIYEWFLTQEGDNTRELFNEVLEESKEMDFVSSELIKWYYHYNCTCAPISRASGLRPDVVRDRLKEALNELKCRLSNT